MWYQITPSKINQMFQDHDKDPKNRHSEMYTKITGKQESKQYEETRRKKQFLSPKKPPRLLRDSLGCKKQDAFQPSHKDLGSVGAGLLRERSGAAPRAAGPVLGRRRRGGCTGRVWWGHWGVGRRRLQPQGKGRRRGGGGLYAGAEAGRGGWRRGQGKGGG